MQAECSEKELAARCLELSVHPSYFEMQVSLDSIRAAELARPAALGALDLSELPPHLEHLLVDSPDTVLSLTNL
jgi:hypothetical protein